mgnify:CR=1 FL=1
MKKRIAVITPGGDSAGMNACIRSVVRAGTYNGFEILGIQRGYSGLLDEDFINLTPRSVSGIVYHGGTMLRSARCRKIRAPEGIREAGAILKSNCIDWMVVIGGLSEKSESIIVWMCR